MAMDLDDLRFVVAVAEELHFGRAATRLGYTASNVSHRIRKVERQLGIQMFERTSRRVQLTVAGAELVRSAAEVLAAADEFDRRARVLANMGRRSLRVVYGPFTNDVTRVLVQALQEEHPYAEVELMTALNSEAVARAVRDRLADVGVGKWPSPLLETLPLQPLAPFGLLVPRGHALAARTEVGIEDLDGEPLLIVDRTQAPDQHDLIVRFYEAAGMRPVFRERVISSIDQVVDFVVTGQGLGEVPMTTLPTPETVLLPVREPRPPINFLHIMWDPDAQPPLLLHLLAMARRLFATVEPDPVERPGPSIPKR
jgi:DNA-binding transcriptional LysR family regulator